MPDATPTLPERVPELAVQVGGAASGQLLRHSVYEYRYARPGAAQTAVSLLMPPRQPTWQDGDLFPSMDQNLPEGDLFHRVRALFPKQALTPMHLLALIGDNGIGRVGFLPPGAPPAPRPAPLTRAELLALPFSPALFDELMRAYLGTGADIAGLQPKILVPDRATIPVPTLIVKAGSAAYPGLAANEFLCLSAARRAGIEVPGFDLSHDGQLLVLDRFDLGPGGERLGFEDVAALMGLRVRDLLSDRKYHGSYERVAELLRYLRLPAASLRRFFEQLALSVMVGNGDAHLKNFGVLYRHEATPELSPLFDVVTTRIYRYTRYPGGQALEDHTLALRWRAGRHGSRAYPGTEDLLRFGRQVCGVARPAEVVQRIAQAQTEVLAQAAHDPRIPPGLLADMAAVWRQGQAHASVLGTDGTHAQT